MIKLTRLNGEKYWINPHQIELIEAKPDVTLNMLSGKYYIVKESVEETFKNTVTGHDSVYVSSSTVNLEDSSVNYALYPVWLLHTTWQGQKYTFAMNGQTGKFVGDLPLDKSAYFRWLGIIGVILSAVICAGITLLH